MESINLKREPNFPYTRIGLKEEVECSYFKYKMKLSKVTFEILKAHHTF